MPHADQALISDAFIVRASLWSSYAIIDRSRYTFVAIHCASTTSLFDLEAVREFWRRLGVRADLV